MRKIHRGRILQNRILTPITMIPTRLEIPATMIPT
jgi:hypothetical protein